MVKILILSKNHFIILCCVCLCGAGLGSKRPSVAFVDSVRESFQERGEAVLQPQRSLSPEGHRSSSLPPRAQRAGPPSTPSEFIHVTLLQNL